MPSIWNLELGLERILEFEDLVFGSTMELCVFGERVKI